jgi:hypothetical protein
MKIRGIEEIISLGQDELSEYDFSFGYDEPYVGKIEADVFIYCYTNKGYSGSGVAAWRKDGEWSYQYLGHCSCYGPLEDVRTSDKMKFTLKQVIEILESKDNSWMSEANVLATYLKSKYKK